MSRGKHFRLTLFPGLEMEISISKSFEEKTSFVMTWKDPNTGVVHRVNTLRVVPKETGVRPTAPDHIHQVLGWLEPESGYEYVDEESGERRILAVDKSVLDKLFPKSDKIKVECFLPQEQISFADMQGDHYYLTPRVESKTKTSSVSDVQGYAMLCCTGFSRSGNR